MRRLMIVLTLTGFATLFSMVPVTAQEQSGEVVQACNVHPGGKFPAGRCIRRPVPLTGYHPYGYGAGGYGAGGYAGGGHGAAGGHGGMLPGGAHYRPQTAPAGGPVGTVAYPYYTIRGPRDFLQANPPSIGPY